MKILANGYKKLLNKENTDSGSEVFMASLLPYLKQRKHTLVNLLLWGTDGPEIEERDRFSSPHGDYVLYRTYFGVKKIKEAKSRKLPESILIAVKNVEVIIQEEKPDIVFINGFSWSNWILLKAAANLKIPIYSVLHGLWFNEISTEMSKHGVKLTLSMEADIAKYSNRLFFVSEYSLEQFEKNLGKVDRKKLALIPLPYNPIFESQPKPQNKGKIINIGQISRWDPIKNPKAFSETAKKAKELKLPWKFHAVTSFSKNLELAPLIEDYKKYIKVIPPGSPAKLKKFYQQMDLMVLPSEFDVLGAVVMEAALQNRSTLISPNVGWKYDYKKFGLDHLITPFDKPEQTIQLIKKSFRKPPSPKFVKHIKATHSPKTIFNNLINVLESNV